VEKKKEVGNQGMNKNENRVGERWSKGEEGEG